MNGTTRKVLVRPERNGYVYVLDRASGEVLRDSLCPHYVQQGCRSEDRPSDPGQRKGATGRHRRARYLPLRSRSEGLKSVVVLAEDGAALRGAQQPLHGFRSRGGQLHRRHSVHRRQCRVQGRPRRTSRRRARRAPRGSCISRSLSRCSSAPGPGTPHGPPRTGTSSRTKHGPLPLSDETRVQRSRWMSLAGVAFSLWFIVVILAMEVPLVVLRECQ